MSGGRFELLGAAISALTTDAICVVDAKTLRFVEVNAAFSTVFGYSRQEALELHVADVSIGQSPTVQALADQLEAIGYVEAGVRPYRCRDGNIVHMATRICATKVDGVTYYSSVLRDLHEIEQAKRAAMESEQRFRTLTEAAFEAICITDQGRIVDCNEQLGRLLALPVKELIGRAVPDFVTPEWQARLIARFKRDEGTPFEHLARRADGTDFWAESQAKSMQLGDRSLRVTALRDITAQKALEDQLLRSQRLESVGRLAGGIAHDFNNLLTVVLSLVDLLLQQSRPTEEQEDLRQIQAAADRAAALTQQLLAFARRRIVEPKVVSLNQIVSGLDKMLRRLLGEHISLVSICAPELGAVRVDPGQIEQVVVNLAINGRDAMLAGGTLTIETGNVALGSDYTALHPEVAPGEYIMLAVSDTGTGMDAATRERIFEPFFTTKADRGSGLGLSTCYGIVKQCGGSLWVYSEVGRGSTFKIYLPRVFDELDTIEPPKPRQPRRGCERILLVEDDDLVRPVAARALRDFGYEVHEAANPSEARRCFANFEGRFDALITDVVLPEMNGRQLAEELRASNPALRVLYTSGYTENTIVHHGVVDEGIHFLAKPYVSGDLAERLRALLDEKWTGPNR